MVWVRERTIPNERPPLVGEVIANFCWWRMPRGQRDGSLLPHSRFSRQEPLLSYQVAPQLYSRGWVDPVPDPLHFFSGSGRESNPALRICSQALWPLDHHFLHVWNTFLCHKVDQSVLGTLMYNDSVIFVLQYLMEASLMTTKRN
jgi:hypothetical protein